MHKVSTFLLLIIYCNSGFSQHQSVHRFPGTDLSIILPDSSFVLNHDSSGFFSEKFHAKIEKNLLDESNDLLYTFFIRQMKNEFKKPGITVLIDTSISGRYLHVFKVKVEFDVTDMSPVKKGDIGIIWVCIYGKEKGQVLYGEYKLEKDIELNSKYFQSFLSLRRDN
jgi:hypothetical protein